MDSKSKFGFGGGKGLMEIKQKGYFDYFYESFNETISVGRPSIYANNIVMGSMYLDVSGSIECINHRTEEKATLTFVTRGWSTDSYITGNICDSTGQERYTLKGSWIDKVYLVNSQTKQEELIYQ